MDTHVCNSGSVADSSRDTSATQCSTVPCHFVMHSAENDTSARFRNAGKASNTEAQHKSGPPSTAVGNNAPTPMVGVSPGMATPLFEERSRLSLAGVNRLLACAPDGEPLDLYSSYNIITLRVREATTPTFLRVGIQDVLNDMHADIDDIEILSTPLTFTFYLEFQGNYMVAANLARKLLQHMRHRIGADWRDLTAPLPSGGSTTIYCDDDKIDRQLWDRELFRSPSASHSEGIATFRTTSATFG